MTLGRLLIGVMMLAGLGLVPGEAAAQQRVECRSTDFKYRECAVPWQRSELVNRLSQSQCIERQTWGQGNGKVWVDRGCAASFGPAAGGGGWGGGGEMACNSEDHRYRECRTDWRNARLVRQTSQARCIEGQTWGLRRGVLWVDRGCAAVFAEGGGGPGPGPGPQQVECNSENNRYKACPTGNWRMARLVRQTSRAQCVDGHSWGYMRGQVWVDKGCAGVFADTQGGDWGGGGSGRRLTCQSENHRYRECRADGWRGAAVLNKTSRAECVQGHSWGLRRGMLWVDRGCAAEFIETRR